MTSRFDDYDDIPAFPRPASRGEDYFVDPQQGMTLRDYFAAKAMQALLSDPDWRQDMDFKETAYAAYKQADAMLKARDAKT
jgi:hypothetical protein